jgi:hypothetical protein
MKLRRRSFRTAAGWSFARAHAPRLASFGQNARWVRFAKMRRPSPSSFETRVRRARIRGISSACALLRMTTTEVTARRRTVFGNSHLTMSNSHSRSRGAFFTPGALNLCFTNPNRGVGGAPRNVRVRAKHPLGVHMTRHARRLRGALRPMTRDARLSALHRGGFGLPGPRFRLLRRPSPYNGGQVPCGSVQRAPRTQVVVPGGRGPCLPGRAVTSRRRRTPHLAPPSGSSPETPLDERGWEAM